MKSDKGAWLAVAIYVVLLAMFFGKIDEVASYAGSSCPVSSITSVKNLDKYTELTPPEGCCKAIKKMNTSDLCNLINQTSIIVKNITKAVYKNCTHHALRCQDSLPAPHPVSPMS
ncbi:lipid-transfer protein [Striga asiatica]|uniref:Lipid-transfer protein n=1 Tax=Striga asiatica TaxID=4170 RepID=A0A5A7PBK6_STRAF|nr:lipid-transfer protein [Striga asiatica]